MLFKDFNYHTHTLEKNAFISLSLEEIKNHTPEDLKLENSKIFLSLHPWHLPNKIDKLSDEFIELANSELIYGIGEIGLDKNSKISYEIQLYYFEELLKLALKLNKPIQLHVVHAWNDIQQLLKKYPIKEVYFHGFLGKINYLQNILDYGLFVSLNAKMLERQEFHKFIQEHPQYLNKLGLETD